MVKRFFLILGFLFLYSLNVSASEIREISYSYGGNYKALMSMPDKAGKHPVIIYNYHEGADKGSQYRIYQNAHDVVHFMGVFSSWGAICIVPTNRFHQLGSIEGAIRYAKRLPNADVRNIHIVGVSEGAFLSMLAVKAGDGVKSLTLIMPRAIHNTGALSFPGMMRHLPQIRIPVLLMVANQSSDRTLRMSQLIHRVLEQNRKNVIYVEYPENEQWFWSPQKEYMQKIYETFFFRDTLENPTKIWGNV
jgi:hypothetical protein